AFSDGDTTLDGQSKKRQFLSAALDYRNAGFKASLDAYYSKESFKGGTAAMFWFPSTVLPAPDASLNQFPGAWGEYENKAVILRAEYAFNDHVTAFAGIGTRHADGQGTLTGTHVRSINAAGTSTNTFITGQRMFEDTVSSEAGLRFNFNTGAVGHALVLQASRLDLDYGYVSTSTRFTTNIYSPVYQAAPTLPSYLYKTSDSTFSSLALVDTLSMLDDRLRLTLGLRDQGVKTSSYSSSTGALSSTYDESALTPAVGVVYKPWGPNVSLYANYVQGLSQGDSITTAGGYVRDYTFAPYKTEQKETGVKWNAGTFTNTAALFEITKPSLITFASGDAYDATDGGEKRVRGLEWNTFGELTRGVRLLGGVAYVQGVLTKTDGGTYDGNTAVGVPRWQGNLGLEWDVPGVAGLTLTGRIQTSSSAYLDSANTLKLPGWTVFDAGARYATKLYGRNTVFRLNVTNLFDRNYYSGVFSESTPVATLGAPRTVSASVSVDF
ncbi:MAG: TonB-dependent siderophore receptor, partial [Xenophilus sp.]